MQNPHAILRPGFDRPIRLVTKLKSGSDCAPPEDRRNQFGFMPPTAGQGYATGFPHPSLSAFSLGLYGADGSTGENRSWVLRDRISTGPRIIWAAPTTDQFLVGCAQLWREIRRFFAHERSNSAGSNRHPRRHESRRLRIGSRADCERDQRRYGGHRFLQVGKIKRAAILIADGGHGGFRARVVWPDDGSNRSRFEFDPMRFRAGNGRGLLLEAVESEYQVAANTLEGVNRRIFAQSSCGKQLRGLLTPN